MAQLGFDFGNQTSFSRTSWLYVSESITTREHRVRPNSCSRLLRGIIAALQKSSLGQLLMSTAAWAGQGRE